MDRIDWQDETAPHMTQILFLVEALPGDRISKGGFVRVASLGEIADTLVKPHSGSLGVFVSRN